MNIDPSEAHAPGPVIEDEADADLAREVDRAIATILASQAASLDAGSNSVAAQELRNQKATLDILKQLCGDDGVEVEAAPSSSSAAAAAGAGSALFIEHADLNRMFSTLTQHQALDGVVEDDNAMSDSSSGRSGHSSGLDLPGQAACEDVPSQPEAQCTQEQTDALTTVMAWLQADLTHAAGGHSAHVPATPLLFIHGPGGELS